MPQQKPDILGEAKHNAAGQKYDSMVQRNTQRHYLNAHGYPSGADIVDQQKRDPFAALDALRRKLKKGVR